MSLIKSVSYYNINLKDAKILFIILFWLLTLLVEGGMAHSFSLTNKMSQRADFKINSKTYLWSREDIWGNGYTTTYENLNLEIQNLMGPKLSFHSSGWAQSHLDNNPPKEGESGKSKGELTYAYLRFIPRLNENCQIDIGRQIIFTDLLHSYGDGLSLQWPVTYQRGFFFFGGRPVMDDQEEEKSSRFMTTGRAYQRISDQGEVGFFYFMEKGQHQIYSEWTGLDIWFQPIYQIELQGQSSYCILTDRWLQQSYSLGLFPSTKLSLTCAYLAKHYESLGLLTTDLSLIDDSAENKDLKKIMTAIEYALTREITILLDYHDYLSGVLSKAWSAQGGVKVAFGHSFCGGAFFSKMEDPHWGQGYTETHLYLLKEFQALSISFDSRFTRYDHNAENKNNFAFSLDQTFSYAFTSSILAAITLEYLKDPDFQDSLATIFKLEYRT